MILILRRRDKEEGHRMNTLVDLILELRVPLSHQRAKVLEYFAPAAAKTRLTTFLGCILRLLNSKLSFSPSLTVQMEESLFFFFIFRFATPLLSLASGTQQTELSLENDDLLHVLKSYLASCLSCNKPNPSTVSTALFRVLGKVLVKDTWAVYSFLISMLSPPSIFWKRHIEETLDNNQLLRSTDRPTARSASTYNLDWTMVTS